MCEKHVIEWYHSIVYPLEWMGGMCWSCIHVDYICVLHVCSLCACCVCMVEVMVLVLSPCKYWWCRCWMWSLWVNISYALIMHVSIYTSLCIHWHGYSCCAWDHGVWLVWSCIDNLIMVEMMIIWWYDYIYICVALVWLILQMKYPPQNYIEVCWLCYVFVYADMVYFQEEDQICLTRW